MLPPAARGLQRLVSLGEATARTRQRGSHARPFDAEDPGDLRVIQPFLLEQQRLPVALGQRIECTSRVARVLRTLERELGRFFLGVP